MKANKCRRCKNTSLTLINSRHFEVFECNVCYGQIWFKNEKYAVDKKRYEAESLTFNPKKTEELTKINISDKLLTPQEFIAQLGF